MINQRHRQEWRNSAVTDSLTNLNVLSTDIGEAYELLIYAINDRRNDGRLRDATLKAYSHTDKGGWWCAGVDANTGSRMEWGCFKPNEPRANKKGKLIKYEHPPQTNTRLFALRVPYEVGQKIADRFGLSQEYLERAHGKNPVDADRHFWQWAISKKEIPLVITEGAKKSAALLSTGYLAVGLPGIWGAYRQDRDSLGNKKGQAYLIDDIKPLVKDRDVVFAFDQEEKPKTRFMVSLAQKQTAKLMAENEVGEVSTLAWDTKKLPFKGVDDLIANRGEKALDEVFQASFDRIKQIEPKKDSLDYLTKNAAVIIFQRDTTTVPLQDLRRVRYEANLEDVKLSIVPENMIYCRTPKNSEFQNLPPPTLSIETLNYTYHCWKVHGAENLRDLPKLQVDLNRQLGTTPTHGVPMPGICDTATGHISEAKDITAKSYSLDYLRQMVPDRSPSIKPQIETEQSIQAQQQEEYSR
jgi:hypothetical protein